jgi:hypothetical protein
VNVAFRRPLPKRVNNGVVIESAVWGVERPDSAAEAQVDPHIIPDGSHHLRPGAINEIERTQVIEPEPIAIRPRRRLRRGKVTDRPI